MMNKQTVIVIGAGAGVDIDMPVGSKLAGEIAEDTNFRTDAGKRLGGDERVWAASVQMAKLVGIDQSSTLVAGRSIARGITYAQSIDNYVHAHSDKEIIKIVAKTRSFIGFWRLSATRRCSSIHRRVACLRRKRR